MAVQRIAYTKIYGLVCKLSSVHIDYCYMHSFEVEKIVEDKTGASSLGQYKSIGHAPKNCQTHTIEYKVTKIVPQRY